MNKHQRDITVVYLVGLVAIAALMLLLFWELA